MSDKVSRHKALCDELNRIYKQKNHDYGDSFHQSYIEEGLAMPRIRLGDKFNRFKTLSRNMKKNPELLNRRIPGPIPELDDKLNDGRKVFDETIRDTLMDLANYAIMTILELDEMQS